MHRGILLPRTGQASRLLAAGLALCSFLSVFGESTMVECQILQAAVNNDLPVALFVAVAWHESRFKADRVSSKGAVGPVQILPVWFTRTPCKGLARNMPGAVECGARLLAMGRQLCGSWQSALGWYNTGKCIENRYSRYVRSITNGDL